MLNIVFEIAVGTQCLDIVFATQLLKRSSAAQWFALLFGNSFAKILTVKDGFALGCHNIGLDILHE